MNNEKTYKAVETITQSQEYTQSDCTSKDNAMEIINLLRTDIKTLVNIIYECGSELKDLKKVADMLQKVEKAKSRFLERAVENALRDDHYDIMPYDARKRDAQKMLSIGDEYKVGKIDLQN